MSPSTKPCGQPAAQKNIGPAGVTLVIVTHSLELAASMGRIFQLQDGVLLEQPKS